jgi:hypothetical protein
MPSFYPGSLRDVQIRLELRFMKNVAYARASFGFVRDKTYLNLGFNSVLL